LISLSPFLANHVPWAPFSHAGNTVAETTINMGHEVIAATYEGARAAAGSKVADAAEDKGMHTKMSASGNSNSFRARHVNNKGSHAFTENGGTSSATAGQGNGPVAMAFGLEVAAFSRSHRNQGLGGAGEPRDGFP
jgi:hypothetical protein